MAALLAYVALGVCVGVMRRVLSFGEAEAKAEMQNDGIARIISLTIYNYHRSPAQIEHPVQVLVRTCRYHRSPSPHPSIS